MAMCPTVYEKHTIYGVKDRSGGLYLVLSASLREAYYLPREGLQGGVTARVGDTLELFRAFPAVRGGVKRALVNGTVLWQGPVDE